MSYPNKPRLTIPLSLMTMMIIGLMSFNSLNRYTRRTLAQSTDPSPLETTLIAVALSNLKAEYDVLISGKAPTQQMVTRFDGETRQEQTGASRIASAQIQRQADMSYEMSYTSADVSLKFLASRDDGTNIFLDAIESTTLHFVDQYPADDSHPKQTDMVVPHTFVFARASGGYQLIYDSTGCDPHGYHACDSTDDSNFCCYEDEPKFQVGPAENPAQITKYPTTQPSGASRPSSGCDYVGLLASAYAYNFALSRNPNFRQFGNDCTNFVSQALYLGGGWTMKGFGRNYKNWNLWWYDRYGGQNQGQTRTWTQSMALDYFFLYSGRAFNTTYACDLNKGDVIFADWENDGVMDHTMIITGRSFFGGCNAWDQIYLSYHTLDRRDRKLVDIANANPRARFYCFWVCHNTP